MRCCKDANASMAKALYSLRLYSVAYSDIVREYNRYHCSSGDTDAARGFCRKTGAGCDNTAYRTVDIGCALLDELLGPNLVLLVASISLRWQRVCVLGSLLPLEWPHCVLVEGPLRSAASVSLERLHAIGVFPVRYERVQNFSRPLSPPSLSSKRVCAIVRLFPSDKA